MNKKRIIVVGAGPAGLTAAWELVSKGCEVIVLESDPNYVGGLARTINYKGFRFDIGAHRFFTKNRDISQWWRARLPNDFIRVKRLTRIYYRGRFFHYPLRAGDALFGLGLFTSAACIASYLWRKMSPVWPERSFEDWVINRFGDRLYHIFFKTYTEKIWGVPCSEISSDWASQRIKGFSLREAILNTFKAGGPSNRQTAKTLVDEFEYPRLGPGMLWEKVRDDVLRQGGRMVIGAKVTRIEKDGDRILSVVTDRSTGGIEQWAGDAFIVSMPLRDCALAINPSLDIGVREAANKLSYRDFMLVVLILDRRGLFPDNWIYIHDPKVKVGRVENFNNWGKDMVPDLKATCLEFDTFVPKTIRSGA